jgi:eukaryotic-like serine/threonine-protein kinase
MKCPYCGAELRANVRFCGTCGKPVKSTTMPTPTQSGTNFSSSLTPGSHLQGGRYIIKKVLGQGGMGAALLATDVRLDGKSVVIKELLSDTTDPTQLAEDVRNFTREVSTLAHIDHPLVPNVTDHFQEGTRYFMVQEYVDGENLETHLDNTNQPIPEREALICASEILDILDYLAQQKPPIVHRDIKPANIIIGAKDRRAHLVDFGIARADETRNAQRKQTSALGTPGYAPPEQYQGNADPRSDLYALAATLHHLLTKRDPRNYPPFTYPPVRTLNAQLSPDIEMILTKALNNDINQRFQNVIEMKLEIDHILQQRFGISGNIDSYTLGTSGPMPRIPSIPLGNTQTASTIPMPTQQAQAQATMTPVQPLVVPPPNTPQLLPQPPQKRRRVGLYILSAIIILALISAVSFQAIIYLNPSHNTDTNIGVTQVGNESIGVTQVGNESIGISDGSIAFDTTLADGALKTQAAQQLAQNPQNTNAAISLLDQAITKNTNDAEALIYKEDINVLTSGSPYVTLVVATMLSGDQATISVGRDDLQGAYVAQKEFNDASKLHGGVQVRLLIANTGSKSSYTPRIAQQIVQLAMTDKTVVGVMGWPFSSYAQEAINILKTAHIPMVSQTASSDILTNASPYFFRVVPSNKVQGIQGALYTENQLHAHSVALFYDPKDPYSQTLAQDFRQAFTQTPQNKVVVTEQYTVGQPGTIAQAIQDALTKKFDAIYFSGYAGDISTLLANLPLNSTLPVMGGDALYELGGYQRSVSAQFTHLHFTAFAYPDEWSVLGHSAQTPPFFSEYSTDFNPNNQHPGGSYGFTRASNDAILSYDATVTLLTAYNNIISTGKQTGTPQNLQQALTKLNGNNAIQGVSGQISLGPDGDPVDKAIVVLYIDAYGRIHMSATALNRFLK